MSEALFFTHTPPLPAGPRRREERTQSERSRKGESGLAGFMIESGAVSPYGQIPQKIRPPLPNPPRPPKKNVDRLAPVWNYRRQKLDIYNKKKETGHGMLMQWK